MTASFAVIVVVICLIITSGAGLCIATAADIGYNPPEDITPLRLSPFSHSYEQSISD